MQFEGIDVDLGRWPHARVAYRTFSDDAHAAHFVELRRIFEERQEPFTVLVDLVGAQPLNAQQRRDTSDFWKDVKPLAPGRMLALAFVIDNVVVRGIVRAISWIQPPPCEHRVFANAVDAQQWLAGQYAEQTQRRSA